MAFLADAKVQQIAEAYAQDAAAFAQGTFGERLDWTDRSIEQIEKIASRLHHDVARVRPSKEQIFQFAKMLGSYVGEVYRRNHEGTWGKVTLEGQEFPGLRTAKGTEFWPWGKVQNRITNGPEDNVWHYYQVLLQQEGFEVPPRSPSPPKSNWWKRVLGG
jgi:hypothetical protein